GYISSLSDEQLENLDVLALNKLLAQTTAFVRSVERLVQTREFHGVVDKVVNNYEKIYAKANELIPDDDYLSETVVLEVSDDMEEIAVVRQVVFVAGQLRDYLRDMLRGVEQSATMD